MLSGYLFSDFPEGWVPHPGGGYCQHLHGRSGVQDSDDSDVTDFDVEVLAELRTGAAWASFIFGDTPPNGRRLIMKS
jgi:hypothetical protein